MELPYIRIVFLAHGPLHTRLLVLVPLPQLVEQEDQDPQDDQAYPGLLGNCTKGVPNSLYASRVSTIKIDEKTNRDRSARDLIPC